MHTPLHHQLTFLRPAEAASTVVGTTATVVNESPITAASTKDLIFLFIFDPLIVSQNKRVLFSRYLQNKRVLFSHYLTT